MMLYKTLPILTLLSSLCQLPSVEATITLIGSGNKVYRTAQEKNFGKNLSLGVEYVARLQLLGSDGYGDNVDNDLFCNINNVSDLNKNLIIPPDQIPVALLVPIGKCSSQIKAMVASSFKPQNVVRHLIIYGNDNRVESDDQRSNSINPDPNDDDDYIQSKKFGLEGYHHQVPLQSALSPSPPNNVKRKAISSYWHSWDHPSIKVSVLYVSHEDGLDMIQRLQRESQRDHDKGGFQILVDGYDGLSPYYDDTVTAGDIISIIALILLCCMTFSCIFSSTPIPHVGAGGIHVVDEDEDLLPGRYRHGLRLLNRDEVLSLPQIEFGLEKAMEAGDEGDKKKSSETENINENKKCCSGSITMVSIHDESDDDSISTPTGSTSPLLASPLNETKTVPKSTLSPGHDVNEPFHDVTCTICLDDYKEGENLVVLPCHHAFHADCILPWLTERSPTCPLCKALMEVEREGDEEHRRQREEARRLAEEEQEQESSRANTDSDGVTGDDGQNEQEASSINTDGNGEGVDDNQSEQERVTRHSLLDILRAINNNSSPRRRPRQEERDIETATPQEVESEVIQRTSWVQRIFQHEPEVEPRARRSRMTASSWRRFFVSNSESDSPGNDIEPSVQREPENNLPDMEQPLLNNEGNQTLTGVV